jgi:hypothetical protein
MKKKNKTKKMAAHSANKFVCYEWRNSDFGLDLRIIIHAMFLIQSMNKKTNIVIQIK